MKIISFFLAMICSSNLLLSDQAAWITKREANAASRFVKKGDIVYSYCAPCGDDKALMIEVSSVSVKKVGEERYHELRINNTGVDLAYIYVIQDSKYENLAMLNNIEVQDVPRYLSDEIMFDENIGESAENLIAELIVVQMLLSLEGLELLMEDDFDKLEYANVLKDGLIISIEALEKNLDNIFQGKEEKLENDLIISILDEIAAAFSSYSIYLEFGTDNMLAKTNYYFESADSLLELLTVETEKEAEPTNLVCIETKFGKIQIELIPEIAPNHVENFKIHVQNGYYDGTTFHRVIPGFMIQGGDPLTKTDDREKHGTGGNAAKYFGIGNKSDRSTWKLPAEFNSTLHDRGIVSMARSQNPDSGSSQFFICVAKANYLDNQYTVFGKVISGMDVVDQIVNLPRDKRDNPEDRVEVNILFCN